MADTMNVFCIVHGGDELYYLTDADFNDTLWAGLNDLPYQKLTAIGQRTDIGSAAEIQQSGSCDYDITFDYDANTVKVEHYVKHYTQAFNWSELARVAIALNEFSEDEFDNQTTFETLDDVHLVYTTITDFEIPLQVSVDLVQKQIAYTLQGENDVLAKTDMYSSLKQIAESIENSAFDDWVTVYDLPADKICEYLEKNVEKMKMYDGTECFVIGKWTDTGIDGDIPVEFMIGAEYNFDKNDFDYYMQAYITDGDYKGYYLGENIYDHPIIKQDAVSALTDKIAEIAIDRNEARADGWNEDEELDLTLKDKGRS
ncbi:MAG: hypothetical protein K6F27_08515 [Ruminococcus sp.]|nr:hypothetical protein [Ruminococcus sp.]